MKNNKIIISQNHAFSLWTHRAEGGADAPEYVPRAESFAAAGAEQWSVIIGGSGRVEAWFIHLKENNNMIQLDGPAGRPVIHEMGRRAA